MTSTKRIRRSDNYREGYDIGRAAVTCEIPCRPTAAREWARDMARAQVCGRQRAYYLGMARGCYSA